MRHIPRAVMVFAAGFGTRMGALTADRPKPLIRVAGRTLIDRALDLAAEAGSGPVVVNVHYRGDQIIRHLAGRGIAISDESERILDTGGGLRRALPLLGDGPVCTLNPDVVWTGANPLTLLRAAWDPARMDALLLLLPVARAAPPSGRSDFVRDPLSGRIARAGAATGDVFLGAQIIATDGLAAIPDQVFSLNRLWDAMIDRGRAYGLIHRGGWCDVGHPDGIAQAEAMLAADG
ncbi:MAG: nucleotidyltransferase family protein [Gemmobacter sp.]